MNLYTVEFTLEANSKQTVAVQARNKVEAVSTAYSKLTGWRNKDRVTDIHIVEDLSNQELGAQDYK